MPIVKIKNNIAQMIIDAIGEAKLQIVDGDIFVIAHTIISRAEGKQFFIPGISPSPIAEIIARKTGKDPSLVDISLKYCSNCNK